MNGCVFSSTVFHNDRNSGISYWHRHLLNRIKKSQRKIVVRKFRKWCGFPCTINASVIPQKTIQINQIHKNKV